MKKWLVGFFVCFYGAMLLGALRFGTVGPVLRAVGVALLAWVLWSVMMSYWVCLPAVIFLEWLAKRRRPGRAAGRCVPMYSVVPRQHERTTAAH